MEITTFNINPNKKKGADQLIQLMNDGQVWGFEVVIDRAKPSSYQGARCLITAAELGDKRAIDIILSPCSEVNVNSLRAIDWYLDHSGELIKVVEMVARRKRDSGRYVLIKHLLEIDRELINDLYTYLDPNCLDEHKTLMSYINNPIIDQYILAKADPMCSLGFKSLYELSRHGVDGAFRLCCEAYDPN